MRASLPLLLPALALLAWWATRPSAPKRPEPGAVSEADPFAVATPPPARATGLPAAGQRPPPAVLAVETAPVLPAESTPGVLRHWHGRLVTPLRDRAPGPNDDFHLPLEFDFPLDGGRHVRVHVNRLDLPGPDQGVFIGQVSDEPGSTIILSYVGLAQAGVVHLPARGRSYVIQGDASGHLRITENDLSQAPGRTPPLLPPRS